MKDNIITKVRGVCLVRGLFSLLCITVLAVTAIFFTACEFNFDSRPEEFGPDFIPVESIYGVPTGGMSYVGIPLTGTVMPENATERKIEWSLKSGNWKLEGNKLTVETESDVTVTVTATVKNGLGEGKNYTQDFNIRISLTSPYAVTDILGIPSEVSIGNYELNGRVVPSNAINTTITYEVIEPGITGAEIHGYILHTRTGGKVQVRATVQGGRLLDGDFTQDFTIVITKTGIFATGYRPTTFNTNNNPTNRRAYYWKDGIYTHLEVPVGATYSYTSGIVFAGGKQYVAGWYGNYDYFNASTSYNYTACYWVNDTRVDLDSGFGTLARTYSIAADGTDVYIIGIVNDIFCYWKITGGSGTGTKQNLPLPTGQNFQYGYTRSFTGSFTVNNGAVYIPFEAGSNYSYRPYYWDGSGTAHLVDTTFTINGAVYPVAAITSVAVLNGTMYMAGRLLRDYSLQQYSLVYWVKDAANCTILADYEYGDGGIHSIVLQDGAPRFYGASYYDAAVNTNRDYCYWDAAGNRTFLPDSSYDYDTSNVVYADGDVYIIIGQGYENNIGYTIVGGRFRAFDGSLTGIAVPGANMGLIIPATGVTLNKNTLALQTGGGYEVLTATLQPENATNKAVTWTSSNAGIASVTPQGRVTAVAVGTATITVTTADGNFTATCTVTVTNPAAGNQTPAAADYTVSNTTHTYDGTGKPATITANAGKSPGSVTVFYTLGSGTPSATAPVNAGTYAVTFNVAPAAGWNSATNLAAGNLVISRANINASSVDWPAGLTAVEGQTLSQIALPVGGESTVAGHGTFSWTTPHTVIGATVNQTHSMTFAPTSANYNTVTNNVSITVTPSGGPLTLTYELIPDGANINTYRVIGWAGNNGTEVIIPDTYNGTSGVRAVTEIADHVFQDNTSITKVTFGANMKKIVGYDAFSGCTGINTIIINATAPATTYSDPWGRLFNDASPSLSVTINNNVADYLLSSGSKIASVTIADGITSIGQYAFNACANLTEITIPEGVTSIGTSAFYSCTSLADITIPESVTSIGSNAFFRCSSLTSVTIHENLTFIGRGAFSECAGLTSIIIDNDKTAIIGNANNATTGSAFSASNNWGHIFTPGFSPVGSNYTVTFKKDVPEYAFQSNTPATGFRNSDRLVSVIIEEGVTSIGQSAFQDCRYLASVTIPSTIVATNAANIQRMFMNCESLSSVTIAEGIGVIGTNMFNGCASLASITIPASVTSIGAGAFGNCTNLGSVTFAGGSTTIANANAFPGATAAGGLKTVYDASSTKAGTYTTTPPVNNTSMWAKQ